MFMDNLGWIILAVFAALVVVCVGLVCNYWRKVYWPHATIKKQDLDTIELSPGWDDFYTVGCVALSYGDNKLCTNFANFDTANSLQSVLVGPGVIGQTIGTLPDSKHYSSYESDDGGATANTPLVRRRKDPIDIMQYNTDPYRVKSLLLTIYGTTPDGKRVKRTGNVKVLFDDENVHASKHEENGIILNKDTLKQFGVNVRCHEEYIDFSSYYNRMTVTQQNFTKEEFVNDFRFCNGISISKHYKFLASDSPSIDPKMSIAIKCQ